MRRDLGDGYVTTQSTMRSIHYTYTLYLYVLRIRSASQVGPGFISTLRLLSSLLRPPFFLYLPFIYSLSSSTPFIYTFYVYIFLQNFLQKIFPKNFSFPYFPLNIYIIFIRLFVTFCLQGFRLSPKTVAASLLDYWKNREKPLGLLPFLYIIYIFPAYIFNVNFLKSF